MTNREKGLRIGSATRCACHLLRQGNSHAMVLRVLQTWYGDVSLCDGMAWCLDHVWVIEECDREDLSDTSDNALLGFADECRGFWDGWTWRLAQQGSC